MSGFVLSLFPGIGLLDMAFEEEGFCVVRGPDLLWGGDVHTFHPPARKFDGVIGGPPCQMFSALAHLVRANGNEPKFGNLIPEFERVVEESAASWFLMENVPAAPVPQVKGYWSARLLCLNNRWFGAEQNRVRRFSFGMRFDLEPLPLDVSPDITLFEAPYSHVAVKSDNRATRDRPRYRPPTVLAGHGPVGRGQGYTTNLTLAEMCELQGLPANFTDHMPFTVSGKRSAIGNGVPLPTGRAIARAVKRALAAS